jgi:hypothetical protein
MPDAGVDGHARADANGARERYGADPYTPRVRDAESANGDRIRSAGQERRVDAASSETGGNGLEADREALGAHGLHARVLEDVARDEPLTNAGAEVCAHDVVAECVAALHPAALVAVAVPGAARDGRHLEVAARTSCSR